MTRTGKIARLPLIIRDELNQRLQNGETQVELIAWLNDQAEVRRLLHTQFDGVPISPQNLSEWKAGGYAEWQARQDLLADACDLSSDGLDLTSVTQGHLLSDHLAAVLAARYAS